MKRFQTLLLMLLVMSLCACTNWFGQDVDDNSPFKGMTAKQLYTLSEEALAKKQYASASKRLEALETMYPFSQYAEKAQLQLINAYYQDQDYASSAATAERYIHLYPRAAHVDYAYYMKGLANFQQSRGTMAQVLPIDESWRDPGTQSQSYADFSLFIQRFPDSRYKPDALQRLTYLRNTFAQRELNTATYYYERKMYVAAAERASYLVKNYPQAPSAQPGLAMLIKANEALGLRKAAAEALAVYKATYNGVPA